MRCLLPVLFFLGSSLFAADPAFVHARGKSLVDAKGQPILLRGINLGNWLVPEGYMFKLPEATSSFREIDALVNELIGPEEAGRFWKAWRERYITERDIQFISAAGFNSVRVPMHYAMLESGEALPLLDALVGWCRKAGLWVILDLHAAPGGQTGTNIDDSSGYPWLFESPAAQQRTVAIWRKLAERYASDPTVLGYDLLNEPIPHFPALRKYDARLEPLFKRITAAIREVDPNHVVIFGGAQWDSDFSVFGPPFDKNSAYTFHKYWTSPKKEVIEPYLAYRDKHDAAIWMGESGENTDAWIAEFRKTLEENQVGWAFWPYKKMDATSCVLQFGKPANWDKVVEFSKTPGGVGQAEKRIPKRPSLEEARAAFTDLLDKIQFVNGKPNAGYLGALGMKLPPRP